MFHSGLNICAQGILDSLTPQLNSSENTMDTLGGDIYFPYSKYKKDSIKLVNLKDSLQKEWELDTVNEKNVKSLIIDFDKNRNKEFRKNQIRPRGLTLYILLIMILLAVKLAFFKGFWIIEYYALRGSFALNEWLDSKITLLDVYHISTRVINYIFISVLFAYALDYADLMEYSFWTLIRLFIAISIISILRHIAVACFAFLIQNKEVFTFHFRFNHLSYQVVSPFLFIAFLFSYFSNDIYLKNWFLVVCVALLGASFLLYLALFLSKFLFSRGLNKFYLFFYLCTFEIIPVCLLINWLSKNLL